VLVRSNVMLACLVVIPLTLSVFSFHQSKAMVDQLYAPRQGGREPGKLVTLRLVRNDGGGSITVSERAGGTIAVSFRGSQFWMTPTIKPHSRVEVVVRRGDSSGISDPSFLYAFSRPAGGVGVDPVRFRSESEAGLPFRIQLTSIRDPGEGVALDTTNCCVTCEGLRICGCAVDADCGSCCAADCC